MSRQRRWIMLQRKAIRFSLKHTEEELETMRKKAYLRSLHSRRKGYKATMKHINASVKYALAATQLEFGHLWVNQ